RRGLTPRPLLPPLPPPPPAEEVQPLPPAAMTPHLARSGGPGACDSSGSLRPHLHLTPRTRPSAGRPPAARARGDRSARRRGTWGRGGVRRGRRRPERSQGVEPRPRTSPSSRVGLCGTGGGAAAGRAEGRGRRARSGPSTGSPPGGRARPHSGGWGRGTPKPKRAGGPEQQLLSPGSLPRSGRPAAGWPESRRQPGEGLTYTVNELVAPRVQFLPKAASLNGALLPPTHPRHLLPPARPCLHRGPAHAQPRRPGPRTHPRPGRRASRRGRRGGRAGLTSRWPRRAPWGGLGARPPRTQRCAISRLAVSAAAAALAFQKAPSSGRSWAPLAPC
ncbi:hypothetical protein EI555_021587, partial [Monodon monoceros]